MGGTRWRFSTLALTAVIALVSPALAQKVDVDYAHQEDFSTIASYKWGKNKAQLPDALQDAHIKDKIDRILQSKGLRKVDSGGFGRNLPSDDDDAAGGRYLSG